MEPIKQSHFKELFNVIRELGRLQTGTAHLWASVLCNPSAYRKKFNYIWKVTLLYSQSCYLRRKDDDVNKNKSHKYHMYSLKHGDLGEELKGGSKGGEQRKL